ncbi:EamA family transporter, partial [Bacillus sp. D-CC]
MKKDWIAPLALLFVSFIWGATFVVVQNAMSFVGPFTFNGIRFLFAGIILLFVQMIFSKKTSKQDIKQSSQRIKRIQRLIQRGYSVLYLV